jgi:hypothetical protein
VTVEETFEEVKEQEPDIPDDIKDEVTNVEMPEVVETKDSETYVFHRGWNFVYFPVLPNGVQTLEGLYPHLYPQLYDNPTIIVNREGYWFQYSGEGETGEITAVGGMAVYTTVPFSVTMYGDRVAELFELQLGLNFVGVPEGYEVPSDFLGESLAVLREVDGSLYLIGRAGDSGDTPFSKNEAVALIVADVAAAPMAPRSSVLTTTWGGLKNLR